MSGDRSGFMFEPLKSVPLNQEINEQKNVPKLQENCVPGMDSKEAGYWCKCMNCQTMPTYRCRCRWPITEKHILINECITLPEGWFFILTAI